jgi:ATP-dependent helicase/nuclease subunit B
MLQIFDVFSPQDRDSLLSTFDPTQTTWVVSDLRSKFEIQNRLMRKQGFFEDHSVLRASELWRLILRRSQPDMQIVSRDFLKAWLREKLSQTSGGAPEETIEQETLLDFIDLGQQIISHPEGPERLTEWLTENKVASEKWGQWFQLSLKAGREILQMQKMHLRGVAPYLTNQIGWENFWNRNLIVDLGAELSRAEADLLRTLSRHIDIQLLRPHLQDELGYKYLLSPYEEIAGFGASAQSLSAEPPEPRKNTGSQEFLRLTGPLSEVKLTIEKVRAWLESGVLPQLIAVIAPDIESYWPLLEIYFQKEGIPVAKEVTVRLQSLPHIGWWTSRLKVATRHFEYPDLETSAFQRRAPSSLRYEKFAALFKNLLGPEDLGRDSTIHKLYTQDEIPRQAISAIEFCALLGRFWPEEGPVPHLELVIKEILQVNDDNLAMKFANWVYWLEQIVGKMEISQVFAHRDGVQVMSLSSADSPSFAYRIFLGLTESAFKKSGHQLISSLEIEKIFRDTGFQLPHPEESALQFQLEWIAKLPAEDIFCYPMTQFSGSAEAPHPFWIRHTVGQEVPTSIPQGGRLDSLLRQQGIQDLAQSMKWNLSRAQKMEARINADLGLQKPEKILLATRPSLSASQLETFHDCRFKFAAGKLFHLLDEADLDLDPDSRAQGQIAHQFLEKLTVEPRRYNHDAAELAFILDEVAKEKIFGDVRLWPPLRERLVRMGHQFLKFEEETRPQRLRTSHRELKFTAKILDHQWSGFIDRVDELADGSFAIYDYKASDQSYGIKTWLKNNHLQVAFYAWAIEKGHIEELRGAKISGALYYIYKNLKLKGAEIADQKQLDILRGLYADVEQKIQELIIALSDGDFSPQPLDKSICTYCQWSRLCRAPHLA